MSRRRYGKRRTKIEGQFAPRSIDLLRSSAMAALSLTGRRILDRLEIELADHGGNDNGQLPCTFEDFGRFGINRKRIAAGIRECVALGFVEVAQRGSAGNREHRRPNLYRLTYRHTDFADPTDEWRRLQSDDDAKKAALEARGKKQNFAPPKDPVSHPLRGAESHLAPHPLRGGTGSHPLRGATLDISGRGDIEEPANAHAASPKGRRSRGGASKAEASERR